MIEGSSMSRAPHQWRSKFHRLCLPFDHIDGIVTKDKLILCTDYLPTMRNISAAHTPSTAAAPLRPKYTPA